MINMQRSDQTEMMNGSITGQLGIEWIFTNI